MTELLEAVYEGGAFRPLKPVRLREGQRVTISVEPIVLTPEEAEAQLRAWHTVYQGLSEDEIAEVEAIALDRSNLFPQRDDVDER